MVIILRGCSGSGKSTHTNKLLKGENTASVSADHYFSRSGTYKFDFSQLGAAHNDCMRRFIGAVQDTEDDYTVIVDNTNTSMREVKPYALKAIEHGHTVKILTIVVDPAIAHARNAHGVPLATVEKQSERLLKSIGTFPEEWPEEVIDG